MPSLSSLAMAGQWSMRYEMQIKTAVKRCYFAVEPCIVYTTRQLLPAAKRMYYTLHIKATLFINFCATAIVGTWVVRLKGYNRGLSSSYLKLFFKDLPLKTEVHSPTLASQSEALKLKLLSPLQDNLSYKTLHVHVNTMMTNFPFLLEAVLFSSLHP